MGSRMKSIAILLLSYYSISLIIQPSTGCWFLFQQQAAATTESSNSTSNSTDSGNSTQSNRTLYAEERMVNRDTYNLAQQAFTFCNNDGEEGLAWDEIRSCEELFCGLLTLECPSEDDFKAFDINEDGILTWNEFMEVNLAMSGSGRSAIE